MTTVSQIIPRMGARTRSSLIYSTGFMWFGIVVALISGDFTLFPDSSGYQVSEGYPISFVGDSWRAWPTPLLFSLTEDYRLQALLQAVLYGTAWTCVIWVFLRRSSWIPATLTSLAIAALALSPLYLQWTMTILSEATTLSLSLLGLAGAQEFVRRIDIGSGSKSLRYLLAFASLIAFSLASVSRLTLVIVLAPIGVTFALVSWRNGYRVLTGALVGCLIILVSYTVWSNSRIDEHWGVSRTATYYGYLTASETNRQEVLADKLFNYMTDRSPDCLARHRADWLKGPDPYELRSHLAVHCPEGVAWLEGTFQFEYAKFAVTNPSYTFRYLLTYLPQVTDSGGYGRVTSILPAAVSSLYTSSTSGEHDFRPIYLWLALWFCFSLITIRRLASGKGDGGSGIVPLVISCASVVALLATVMTTNLEESRVASQTSALLIVSVILMASATTRMRS